MELANIGRPVTILAASSCNCLKELDEWSKKWLMSFNPDKTESMLFSNTEIPELNFTFNGRTIPITNSHKHIGVTFSSDAPSLTLYKLEWN
jgi:hypothetical protein